MKKLKNILNEVLSERLVRGLKPLLMIGSTIKSNVGEKALVDLSDKFDQIDDEQADDIASHLNMAIELMQDRSPSEARGWLKKFNKACADALSGRSIKSAFEGVDENTTDGPRYKKYVAKAFEDILGAQFDFRHAMGVKQLTNKDMKLKKKADAIYKAIIDLQKDMKSKGLTEVQAMNMDTVPYNTIMKMKPGSTIKMKDGKIRTKDKFGNWRADTDRNDIIANRDVIKHMKGMKGFNIGNGRVRIEGKAGRKI